MAARRDSCDIRKKFQGNLLEWLIVRKIKNRGAITKCKHQEALKAELPHIVTVIK